LDHNKKSKEKSLPEESLPQQFDSFVHPVAPGPRPTDQDQRKTKRKAEQHLEQELPPKKKRKKKRKKVKKSRVSKSKVNMSWEEFEASGADTDPCVSDSDESTTGPTPASPPFN
jgi:hypothetical protein